LVQLSNLLPHELGSLLELAGGCPQVLPTRLQLLQLHGPELVGIQQSLLLARERRLLLLELLQLTLHIAQPRPLARLLRPEVGQDQLRPTQEAADLLPDDRLDIGLMDAMLSRRGSSPLPAALQNRA
jgi:hypothetical protein